MRGVRGRKAAKAARRAAANAEIERLCALPVPELAAEILPAWTWDGMRTTNHAARDAAQWIMARFPRYPKGQEALVPAVQEAIQALEHAGLLIRHVGFNAQISVDLTRQGWAAVVEDTAREYLPKDAPAWPGIPAGHIIGVDEIPASVVGLARTRRTEEAVLRYRELTGARLKKAERVVNTVSHLPGASPSTQNHRSRRRRARKTLRRQRASKQPSNAI
jgi:hypothetical protein